MSKLEHCVQLLTCTDVVLSILLCSADIVSDETLDLLADVIHILEHILRWFALITPLLKLHFHQSTHTAETGEFIKVRTQ